MTLIVVSSGVSLIVRVRDVIAYDRFILVSADAWLVPWIIFVSVANKLAITLSDAFVVIFSAIFTPNWLVGFWAVGTGFLTVS